MSMNTHVRIQDFDDASYDPFSAAAGIGGESGLGDIYPELARLRRGAPVRVLDIRRHFGLAADITTTQMRKIAVLGYAAVSEVLGDAAAYSNLVYTQNLGVSFGRSITTMDPPEHPLFPPTQPTRRRAKRPNRHAEPMRCSSYPPHFAGDRIN